MLAGVPQDVGDNGVASGRVDLGRSSFKQGASAFVPYSCRFIRTFQKCNVLKDLFVILLGRMWYIISS
ncbi:hypothetical protein D0469_02515 [Peribacillus saganii]|uniref:Uncharacterized protein n=1 Tax=Peribacillus saganii TaxID=2303992 RepID=A0A372LSP8_9BACI|nr:hypothetical protein D0469_02515 [Peribacillus saganii]